MVSENKLTLDILPLSADTARLVRVYGTEPCIALPGTLPAPEGGSFAVTELGDYCFSEKPRSLPAALSDFFPFHLFYGLIYRKNTA